MNPPSLWRPASLEASQQRWLVKPVAQTNSSYQPQPLPQSQPHQSIIKVDQNESTIGWPAELKEQVLEHLSTLPWERYPQPYPTELEAQLAAFHGLTTGSVLLGHGSNSFVDLIFATLAPANHWIIPQPTFGLFEARVPLHQLEFSPWPLQARGGYSLKHLPNLTPGSGVLIVSPNNPTGCVMALAMLKTLITTYPDNVFVCDAAYIEFSGLSYTSLLRQHGNLIIMRTFSKAYGAAGLRLGYLLGSPELIRILRKFQLPFTINHFATAVLTELLRSPYAWLQRMDEQARRIAACRDELYHDLTTTLDPEQCFIYPSGGNFLCLTMSQAVQCEQLNQHLKAAGIIVRHLPAAAPAGGGALRITVGTATENAACHKAITWFFTA